MTGVTIQARPVIAGEAAGRILRLDEPLSFWGDVDPATGCLTDPRSLRHGLPLATRILVLPATRGSSSSSAVVLELLARGLAPAAIVLGRADAIVGLGILVGREMGHATIPLLELPAREQARLPDGAFARIDATGVIRVDEDVTEAGDRA